MLTQRTELQGVGSGSSASMTHKLCVISSPVIQVPWSLAEVDPGLMKQVRLPSWDLRSIILESSFLSIPRLSSARPPRWPSGSSVRLESAKTRSSIPSCAVGIFPGRVEPVTKTLALQWLPCQAPDALGSTLGLVGPVSVHGDWVRQKV